MAGVLLLLVEYLLRCTILKCGAPRYKILLSFLLSVCMMFVFLFHSLLYAINSLINFNLAKNEKDFVSEMTLGIRYLFRNPLQLRADDSRTIRNYTHIERLLLHDDRHTLYGQN